MRKTGLLIAITSPLFLGACSSSITDALSGDLQDRIDTLNDCFEPLFEKADLLFEIAQSWRLNTASGPNIPDPAGLTSMQEADGSLTVTYVAGPCTFNVNIKFYDAMGVEQTDIDLTGLTTLNEKIDAAATELRNRSPGDVDKYMVASWTVTGVGITGEGGLTGIIGGTANDNELELLITTVKDAAPVGSNPPPADSSTITITGMQTCELTFQTRSPEHLATDTLPTQTYPIGVVNMSVTGTTTVSVTGVFDGTVNAQISIDGASATLNLETLELSGFST